MSSAKLTPPDKISLAEVGRQLGVTRVAVWNWFHIQVPVSRLLDLERITGIPREKLRPDLYRQRGQADGKTVT